MPSYSPLSPAVALVLIHTPLAGGGKFVAELLVLVPTQFCRVLGRYEADAEHGKGRRGDDGDGDARARPRRGRWPSMTRDARDPGDGTYPAFRAFLTAPGTRGACRSACTSRTAGPVDLRPRDATGAAVVPPDLTLPASCCASHSPKRAD